MREVTYRTLSVQPHHPNDLIDLIMRVESCLALASYAIESNRDRIDRYAARRVHDGQFRAALIPADMDQWMAAMGLSDRNQRRILTKTPSAIRGLTMKIADIDR